MRDISSFRSAIGPATIDLSISYTNTEPFPFVPRISRNTAPPVILFLFHLQSTSLDRDDDAVHNQSADKMESNEQPAWINFPIKFSISIIPSLVFWFFPLGFRDRLFFFLYPTICISVAAILRGRHREYIPEKKKEKKVSNGNLDESRGSRISRRQSYSTFSRMNGCRQMHHINVLFIHDSVTFVLNVTTRNFALSYYLKIIARNWMDYDRALINNTKLRIW